jgi:mannosyl-3-phosphoglycerate phosphatase
MLECVDYPVLVKKPDGSHYPRIQIAKLIRTDGIGPEGWNDAVLGILRELYDNDRLSVETRP